VVEPQLDQAVRRQGEVKEPVKKRRG